MKQLSVKEVRTIYFSAEAESDVDEGLLDNAVAWAQHELPQNDEAVEKIISHGGIRITVRRSHAMYDSHVADIDAKEVCD